MEQNVKLLVDEKYHANRWRVLDVPTENNCLQPLQSSVIVAILCAIPRPRFNDSFTAPWRIYAAVFSFRAALHFQIIGCSLRCNWIYSYMTRSGHRLAECGQIVSSNRFQGSHSLVQLEHAPDVPLIASFHAQKRLGSASLNSRM